MPDKMDATSFKIIEARHWRRYVLISTVDLAVVAVAATLGSVVGGLLSLVLFGG